MPEITARLKTALADRHAVEREQPKKQQRFEITVEGEPAAVVLDPNVWALIKGSFTRER